MMNLPFNIRPGFGLPKPSYLINQFRAKRLPATPSDELDGILGSYHFYSLGPYRTMLGSKRNETWAVKTNAGKKFLKRYLQSVPFSQIRYEHSILDHLAEIEFPAPRLCHDSQGNSIVESDNRLFDLSDFLDGYFQHGQYYFFPPRNQVFWFQYGQSLGLLHQALLGFTPAGESHYGFISLQGDRWSDASWYINGLEQARDSLVYSQDPGIRAVEQSLFERSRWYAQRFDRLDQALQKAALTRQLIHGDFGPYNLLEKPGQPLVIVDYELARYDWRLVDLVAALSSTTDYQAANPDHRQIRQILKGYRSTQPIDAEEISLIPLVWQYKFLRLILSGLKRYIADGQTSRLFETRQRTQKLDWIMRFEADFRRLGQD